MLILPQQIAVRDAKSIFHERKNITRHTPLLLPITSAEFLKPNAQIKDLFLVEDLFNRQVIFSCIARIGF